MAVEAIERLIRGTRAPWILLSYSSGGRATARELDDVLRANGRIVEVIEVSHKRNVMAGMTWTNEWVKEVDTSNREFMFLVERK